MKYKVRRVLAKSLQAPFFFFFSPPLFLQLHSRDRYKCVHTAEQREILSQPHTTSQVMFGFHTWRGGGGDGRRVERKELSAG